MAVARDALAATPVKIMRGRASLKVDRMEVSPTMTGTTSGTAIESLDEPEKREEKKDFNKEKVSEISREIRRLNEERKTLEKEK